MRFELFFATAFLPVLAAAQLQLCGNNNTLWKCDNTRGVTIFVNEIIPNPYHALYQEIWPLTYVLKRLFEQARYDPSESVLVVPGTNIDWDGCMNRRRRKSAQDVLWQNCVAQVVARRMGISKVVLKSQWRQPRKTDVVFNTSPIFHSVTSFDAVDAVKGVRFTVPVLKQDRIEALKFIRDSVIDEVLGEKEKMPKKDFMHVVVYDRLDANWRVWANSPDIMPYIDNNPKVQVTHVREFPTVFATQVRLVRDADVLVGPHGAAFANTIFMREESTVLEIWKCCGQRVEGSEDTPRAWTGWHQPFLGWGLRYVPCRDNITNLMPNKTVIESLWCPNKEPTARLPTYIVEPKILAREILAQVKRFFTRRKELGDGNEERAYQIEQREHEVQLREKSLMQREEEFDRREKSDDEKAREGLVQAEAKFKEVEERERRLSERERLLHRLEERRESQLASLSNNEALIRAEAEGLRDPEYQMERQLSAAVMVCAVATALMSGYMLGRVSVRRKGMY